MAVSSRSSNFALHHLSDQPRQRCIVAFCTTHASKLNSEFRVTFPPASHTLSVTPLIPHSAPGRTRKRGHSPQFIALVCDPATDGMKNRLLPRNSRNALSPSLSPPLSFSSPLSLSIVYLALTSRSFDDSIRVACPILTPISYVFSTKSEGVVGTCGDGSGWTTTKQRDGRGGNLFSDNSFWPRARVGLARFALCVARDPRRFCNARQTRHGQCPTRCGHCEV